MLSGGEDSKDSEAGGQKGVPTRVCVYVASETSCLSTFISVKSDVQLYLIMGGVHTLRITNTTM